jgi:hypothetical protein
MSDNKASPEWCCFFDFTTGKHGCFTDDPIATWVADKGWVDIPNNPTSDWNRVRVRLSFPKSIIAVATSKRTGMAGNVVEDNNDER